MIVPHRLSFYYEHIVRQDLLLKLNCSSIMQVPRIEKLVLVIPAPTSTRGGGSVQNMLLPLENLSGQRGVESEPLSPSKKVRVKKALLLKMAQGNLITQSQVRVCLRKQIMYHFLDKLLMLISLHDYTIRFHFNSVQLTIGTNLLRLFPEVHTQFEWFETVHTLQIVLVTSAKTEIETRLLWTGLLQKEIYYYV